MKIKKTAENLRHQHQDFLEKGKDKTTKSPVIRRLNLLLKTINICLVFYIVGAPFFPALQLKAQQATDKSQGYKYEGTLALRELKNPDEIKNLKPKPTEHTLVIPKIGVDTRIYEGKTEDTLLKGIWHRPESSTPDKGSNTVLTSHRFSYTSGPNTFYSLDKVSKGDKIIVFWKEKEYNYEVFETKVVEPTEISIEDPTKDPILTLYTCTPLWTAKQRLVVKAKLINV